ncbi:hypothetical protein [Sphingomonas mollis]|uniref:Membrane dipeptidase n=1 Tax=Sphingomonas mollis TaxID=2795726 RepID=A0ABS0XUG2_9SPHN|nr:hypothetical protein [Sphingomonas sp. BT553]MBJ6123681.1 hypothetical protein [Sphingomonas sp. BT553]
MIALLLLQAATAAASPAADPASIRAEQVLRRAPVIDGHNDLAWELREGSRVETTDLRRGTDALPRPLQTDIARLRRSHRRRTTSVAFG